MSGISWRFKLLSLVAAFDPRLSLCFSFATVFLSSAVVYVSSLFSFLVFYPPAFLISRWYEGFSHLVRVSTVLRFVDIRVFRFCQPCLPPYLPFSPLWSGLLFRFCLPLVSGCHVLSCGAVRDSERLQSSVRDFEHSPCELGFVGYRLEFVWALSFRFESWVLSEVWVWSWYRV